MAESRLRDINLSKARSALTNGSALFLGDVDERAPACRRLRDLQRSHEMDLSAGKPETLSEGQRTIVRRIAMLELQIELQEASFAKNEAAMASPRQIEIYQRTCNTLRRLLESVNLHKGRVARDVTLAPLEYARVS